MLENRIAYWFEQTGISRRHAAKRLDVTYQTVSNWCSNRSQPDLIQSYLLAQLFHVSMDELINKEEKK